MNLFKRHIVHARFGFAKFGENRTSAIANRCRQPRSFQDFEDRAQRAMLLRVLRLDRDVSGSHAVLPDFFRRKFPARNFEAAKFRAQVLDRAAGIHQSP